MWLESLERSVRTQPVEPNFASRSTEASVWWSLGTKQHLGRRRLYVLLGRTVGGFGGSAEGSKGFGGLLHAVIQEDCKRGKRHLQPQKRKIKGYERPGMTIQMKFMKK